MVRTTMATYLLCLAIIASGAILAGGQNSSATVPAHDAMGVNWGTQASHPLPASIVVQMLKDNGIQKVKLFDSDPETVATLAGTGIEVMLGIPNDQLKDLSSDYENAKDWVKENVTEHIKDKGGVDVRYVAVGNEAYLKSYNGSFTKLVVPAMKNVQKALNEAGFGKIKVTTPLNADVYDSSNTKPSGGDFRADIRPYMKQILQFLHANKAPFVVNIYPFLSLYQNKDFPVNYAFIDGGGPTIDDNGKSYGNAFDANYDTLIYTLKKHGYSDIKIIVGEIGWPTDGNMHATNDMAKKFYDGLFKRMASKKGTPMTPNKEMEVYLFGLLDEDAKSSAPGAFERHWGIFTYDGKPKFTMDISGHGNPKMLAGAKGVQYLEKQWCVYNPESGADEKLPGDINYACSNSDCTKMEKGGSCAGLTTRARASYAFNMLYQTNDQSGEACDFKGAGKVVKKNPSPPNCPFPVQIKLSGALMNLASRGSAVVTVLLTLHTTGKPFSRI